jgi:chromosome segregation ATPase
MEYPVQPEIAYDLEKGLKQHAEELSDSLNAHVLHRQKLAVILEQEFGQVCGGGADESPEEAAIRLLREQITKLTVANERAALLAEENLNLSNRNGVLLTENTELREDLTSAEEEAARFSKQCRLVSARNTELLAEAKEANAAAFRTATRNAELQEDLKSAEKEATELLDTAKSLQLSQEKFSEGTSAICNLLDSMKEQMKRRLGVPKDDET